MNNNTVNVKGKFQNNNFQAKHVLVMGGNIEDLQS